MKYFQLEMCLLLQLSNMKISVTLGNKLFKHRDVAQNLDSHFNLP